MPADDGIGLDDMQSTPPIRPNPKQTVIWLQTMLSLQFPQTRRGH